MPYKWSIENVFNAARGLNVNREEVKNYLLVNSG
ncbi:MAG: hypothetical protein ACI9HX_001004 [Pseudoalteromonas tetraodonis]|jgi:hypothetical protein